MNTTSLPRTVRKGRTMFRMLSHGKFRDVIIKIDRKLGLKYLDFGKESLDDLGLSQAVANGHQSSGYDLYLVLRDLGITHADSILDLGSGKGGALVTMAEYPFRKIVGVEISPRLAEIAKKNMIRLGYKERIKVSCANAAEYGSLSDFSYIYLYNPFPSAVLRTVLENIKRSLRERPRVLRIIYANPQCEDDLRSDELFEKVAEYRFNNRAPIVVYANGPKDV
jgi:SAM-dependent methyltransferase